MQHSELKRWLQEADPRRLEVLWQEADAVRRQHVGEAVHLRGLVEVSNYCARLCAYCGLRAPNTAIERYRMTPEEVLACAQRAVTLGYGTVVLQAGEDPQLTASWVADVVERIKTETDLAVTLSLGERSFEELAAWRAVGADRYLLRIETSNRALFDSIHPPRPGGNGTRVAILEQLRQLNYEVGSGIMIGIPGQTYEDLATDLALFQALDLDMIGVGPFLPHPATPLGEGAAAETAAAADQVSNSELMTYKVVALARLLCPRANIPSTTALATINKDSGRELGLSRGANVVMPNLTPPAYRVKYEIYPGKACVNETAEMCHGCLSARIAGIGRTIGTGRGDSPNKQSRDASERAPARRSDT